MVIFYRLGLILSLTLALISASPATAGPDPAIGVLIPPVVAGPDDARLDYSGCGGISPPATNAAYEQQVVELVNAERWTNGQLPPYKRVDSLDAAARYHAVDLGQDNYFDHNSYDRDGNNQLVQVCGWSARVGTYYTGVRGENIAAGYGNPSSVMAGWMGSSGHRANILSTSPWEIGVGYYAGSGSYGVYWVQDFGKRAGVYPLVINREAALTSTREVALFIYGTWTQMRLKNEDGPWTAWQSFQTNSAWTLSPCGGMKSVTAELKSGSSTVTSSDTIELAVTPPVLGGLPDEVSFTYSIPDGRLYPATGTFTPLNLGDGCAMPWIVSKTGSWIALSVTSGVTPNPFILTPTGFDTQNPGLYPGSLTVNGPAGSSGSPHQITLSLLVENKSWNSIFVPTIFQ